MVILVIVRVCVSMCVRHLVLSQHMQGWSSNAKISVKTNNNELGIIFPQVCTLSGTSTRRKRHNLWAIAAMRSVSLSSSQPFQLLVKLFTGPMYIGCPTEETFRGSIFIWQCPHIIHLSMTCLFYNK